MASNEDLAVPFHDEPQWNSKAAWKLPGWGEPVVRSALYDVPQILTHLGQIVASILVGSMIITRRRGYRIFDTTRKEYGLLNVEPGFARTSDDVARDNSDTDSSIDVVSTSKHPSKKRRCCCATFYTPNTSRFSNHYHSRLLQRFPFLIEMFYWIITYAFYRCTSILSQAVFAETPIWDVAQDHALAVLEFEQFSWLSFLFPITEVEVQQWFMNGHQTFLTILNRSYALIHIPGTVGYVNSVPREDHLACLLTL
jgi:hypothetical protein